MRRLTDWRSRLHRWSRSQRGLPFVWGETDCGALACGALIAMFGSALAVHLPQWNNVRGAALILQVRGSMGAILEELGAKRTTVNFMRSGDILIAGDPAEQLGRECAMVCIDGRHCLLSTRDGVQVAHVTAESEAVVYSLWEVSFRG